MTLLLLGKRGQKQDVLNAREEALLKADQEAAAAEKERKEAAAKRATAYKTKVEEESQGKRERE